MNWLQYAVIVGLLAGQVMLWLALLHLWQAFHHVTDALQQQSQLNTLLNTQLEQVNKSLRSFEADQRMLRAPIV